jgi:WD40 repeat protein
MYRFLSIFLLNAILWVQAYAQGVEVQLAVQQGHLGDITLIDVDPHLETFCTYGKDRKLVVWDYKTGNQMAFKTLPQEAKAVWYSLDGTEIYIQYAKVYHRLQIEPMKLLNSSKIVFPRRDRVGFSSEIEKVLEIKDASISLLKIGKTNKRLKRKTSDYFDQPFTSLAVSNTYNLAFAGCKDGLIYVYTPQLKLLKQLKGHNADVLDVAVTSDGEYLFTASADRSIIKWRLSDLEQVDRITGKSYPLYGVSVNKDGNRLLFGDEIGFLKELNLASEQLNVLSKRVQLYPVTHTLQLKEDEVLYAGKDNRLRLKDGEQNQSINAYGMGLRSALHSITTKRIGFYREPYANFEFLGVSPSENRVAFSFASTFLKPDYLRILSKQPDGTWTTTKKLYVKDVAKGKNFFFLNDSILIGEYNSAYTAWKIAQGGNKVQFALFRLPNTSLINRFNNRQLVGVEGNVLSIIDVYTGKIVESYAVESVERVVALKNNLVALLKSDNSFEVFNGSRRSVFTGHQDAVTQVVYNEPKNQLISSSKDGTLKIWDFEKGELIATILPVGKSNCIYITPDNFYMTALPDLKAFGFKVGSDFYYADQFDAAFNRPDIVAARLGYASKELIAVYQSAHQKRIKKLGFSSQTLNSDFDLPQIEIANLVEIPQDTDDSTVLLKLKASDEKYNLNRVNVYVNGVSYKGSNGISLREKASKVAKLDLELPLASGLNKIEVSCTNDNAAESFKENFEILRKAGKTRPHLYLITIGVSDYKNKAFNLRYAAKDARDIAAFYKRNKFYANTYTRTLTDREVSLESIESLRNFLAAAAIDDHVIIFVSGHGVLDEELNYFFAAHNMDFKTPKDGGVPYEVIEGLLDGIKPLKKLLFMDTCHSGEVDEEDAKAMAVTAKTSTTNNVNTKGAGVEYANNEGVGLYNSYELMKNLFADLRRGTGATVISASGGLDVALESNKWENGLFTYCVLNGLQSLEADTNGDKKVMVSELQQYVFKQVEALSNGLQKPTTRIGNLTLDYRVW